MTLRLIVIGLSLTSSSCHCSDTSKNKIDAKHTKTGHLPAPLEGSTPETLWHTVITQSEVCVTAGIGNKSDNNGFVWLLTGLFIKVRDDGKDDERER
jgi:hypothetical protein